MLKAGILLISVCSALACSRDARAQAPPDLVHAAAPSFDRTDLAGQKISLEQYRGKVVLLNFWATWCAPCRVELPKFEQWQKKFGRDGLQVVAISMDDAGAPVRRTVRRLHLTFPVIRGDAKLGEIYGGVLGLPVTFLIDRDGTIIARIKGEADLDALDLKVKNLIGR